MKKIILTLSLTAFTAIQAFSQISTPRPSPNCTLQQQIGLTDVSIVYSRPSVKDRVIFGDVVPYGKNWRFGANALTKISFSDDVKVQGKELKAGEYVIVAIPSKESFVIAFNSDLKASIGSYSPDMDVLRVEVPVAAFKEKRETFTLDFTEIRDNYGVLDMIWENTRVSLKIEVDFDSKVMAAINRELNVNAYRNYYVAAVYYLENDKDIKQAVSWMQKAVELGGGERYWVLRQQSLILAKAGMKKEAIAAAEKSLALAQKDGDDAYVKMNENSLKEWKTAKK